MSYITECTIALAPTDEPAFLTQYDTFALDYRLSNLNRVYHDDDVILYVFDCNGDSPWQTGDAPLPYLIHETRYLDDHYTLTEYRKKNGHYTETRYHCLALLRKRFPGTDFSGLKERIAYSCQ